MSARERLPAMTQVIETEGTPYTVAFSPDGNRLAIGTGWFYGGGKIILHDLPTGESRTFDLHELTKSADVPAGNASVSCVAFDGSGRFLAASLWGYRHDFAPSYLFSVEDLSLQRMETLIPDHAAPNGTLCSTGICFDRGRIWIRNNTSVLGDVLIDFPAPEDCVTEGLSSHLTHSRLVAVDGEIITGGGGSNELVEWWAGRGTQEVGKACAGLAVCAADGTLPGSTWVVGAPDCERVTAIIPTPDGNGFVSGGLGGELDLWRKSADEWTPKRIAIGGSKSKSHIPDDQIVWATYNPESITGLCYGGDSSRLYSVDAIGEVAEWEDGREARRWRINEAGSARCLAAHPDEPLLAVGVKMGKNRGCVPLFRL